MKLEPEILARIHGGNAGAKLDPEAIAAMKKPLDCPWPQDELSVRRVEAALDTLAPYVLKWPVLTCLYERLERELEALKRQESVMERAKARAQKAA